MTFILYIWMSWPWNWYISEENSHSGALMQTFLSFANAVEWQVSDAAEMQRWAADISVVAKVKCFHAFCEGIENSGPASMNKFESLLVELNPKQLTMPEKPMVSKDNILSQIFCLWILKAYSWGRMLAYHLHTRWSVSKYKSFHSRSDLKRKTVAFNVCVRRKRKKNLLKNK